MMSQNLLNYKALKINSGSLGNHLSWKHNTTNECNIMKINTTSSHIAFVFKKMTAGFPLFPICQQQNPQLKIFIMAF